MKIYQLIALMSTLFVAYALASWIVIMTDYPYKGYFWLLEFALLGASAYLSYQYPFRRRKTTIKT